MAVFPEQLPNHCIAGIAVLTIGQLPCEPCGLVTFDPALHADLEALDISNSCWLTQHALPAVARLTSLKTLLADGMDATNPTRCGRRAAQYCP